MGAQSRGRKKAVGSAGRGARRTSITGEQVAVLNELMRIGASSLETAEVFEGLSEQIRRLIAFDRLVILLHPPGADYLEVYAGAGVDAPEVEVERPRIPIDDTPWAEPIRTGRPVLRRQRGGGGRPSAGAASR